jgi:23S rRNA (uracil1939-C5)-methyltransferase
MTQRVAIDSLDLDANGVGRSEGKVVFVRGALPGEIVQARVVRSKPRFDVAEVASIERESALRVAPRCAHYGTCGGCSMQHVDARGQVSIKQRVLEDALWHIGRLKPQTVARPIAGPQYGYRYRARLSVRHVPKKGGVLVGFHERGSSYVADMRECHVLPPDVAALLLPLRELVGALTLRDRLPQVEVAKGEDLTALVLRVLEPPTDDDLALIRRFGERHGVELWLQAKGPDTIRLIFTPGGGEASQLAYRLPEFGLRMPFRPTDFTQVNHHINATLVATAVRLLDPQPQDRVADLFCGLGNFTLPLATRAAAVLGIEGSATLVARAGENAAANHLAGRTEFRTANLFELAPQAWRDLGRFDRVLVDPPREGALAVAQALAAEGPRPKRVVYVSCNPATLARDAGVLCHEGGWQLRSAGVVNMFPNTSHVESIAVFEPA